MLELFGSVSRCEVQGFRRDRCVRFSVDWPAFESARQCDHPAFGWPWWEPWEVHSLMSEIARIYNKDAGVQQKFLADVPATG